MTVTQIISGKTGRNMDGIGNNNESEILFARNTRFYVEKVGTDADGKLVIYMEEVAKHGAGQLYSEERGRTVQQVRPEESDQMQIVSGRDSQESSVQQPMSGLRAEGDGKEGGITRESRKGFSVDRELDREIRQIVKEAREGGRSETARGRRSARELRERIERHVAKLSKAFRKPTDKKHIPDELHKAVGTMLEAINLESVYTVDPETGKRRKGRDGNPTKRTEAFRALREQYKAIGEGKVNFTGVIDPELMDNLAELEAMREIKLADMNTEQLTTVWNTVKAVEASVNSANRLFRKGRFAGVEELARAVQESSRGKRAKGNYGGKGLGAVTGFGDRLLNMDMLNSLTFLHLFGEGGDALYHELQQARDQKTRIMQRTAELVHDVIGKTDISALQEKMHTFQVSGGEIRVSTAQLMSLYELNKQQQSQKHIYEGGIRPAAQSKGNLLGKLESPPDGVKVTPEDVSRMLNTLTEREIQIADGLQSIMQGYLADEGNRESMKVFGYRKFTEEHYFPINSDPHQIQTKIGDILEGGEQRPVSVAEWGSAKGRTKGANNGLLLGDIFDVFAQHAVDMATYASHLGALEDVNRVRNFTFRNDEGERTGEMKAIIERVAGQYGNAYLDKLLQDISRGTAKSGVSGLSRLTANYKAASVGLNMRVALQQPTAYARAMAVMDPKYLMDPRVLERGGWEKALKYAPIAQWKDWGNFEINQGRQFQNILFNTDSALEKSRNSAMKLAGIMDSLTWGRLWNACELEIAEQRPGLTRGSDAFYQAVAQRFNDVIDQTQVVDNVLGRSQFMRSGDDLAKMSSSYMGEPTQSYNLVYRAYRDAVQEQDPAKRRQAAKRLGRAAGALGFSMFLNAVAQSLWDAVRDDDDRGEKYWARVLKHIGPNFVQNVNPFGFVPYFRDILSVLQGYEVERMDLAAITGFVSAGQNMMKALNGEGRYTVAGAGINLAAELARILGLPAATVKRDLLAAARTIGIQTGDWYFQYQFERAFNHVGYSGNRKEFYDIAFGALADGDFEVYQRIFADLMGQGIEASTMENAMRQRLKSARESDPEFVLSEEARALIGSRDKYVQEEKQEDGFGPDNLAPAAYQKYSSQRATEYRDMMDSLENSPIFQGMDNETRDKVIDAAYSFAEETALEDNAGGQYEVSTKWISKAQEAEEAGVEPWEYVLFKAAYDTAASTKDEEGKTVKGESKQDHVRDWLEEFDGLTENQRALLWSTVYTSEW